MVSDPSPMDIRDINGLANALPDCRVAEVFGDVERIRFYELVYDPLKRRHRQEMKIISFKSN